MTKPIPPDLAEALRDLWEAPEEAREEGYPIPSVSLMTHAERLLLALYRVYRCRYEVYPTEDGEICLGAYSRGNSVLLLYDAAGEVLFLGHQLGDIRRYSSAETAALPDETVCAALAALDNGSGWAVHGDTRDCGL